MPHCFICDFSPDVPSDYYQDHDHRCKLQWSDVDQGWICTDCLTQTVEALLEFEED